MPGVQRTHFTSVVDPPQKTIITPLNGRNPLKMEAYTIEWRSLEMVLKERSESTCKTSYGRTQKTFGRSLGNGKVGY